MRVVAGMGCAVVLGALSGCVLPPPPPAPLVALPGPEKTQAQFQADDRECRSAADSVPAGGETMTPPSPAAAAPAAASGAPPAPAPQPIVVTPGMVYLRCMTSHNNVVQPLAPVRPVFYGYYAPYPIYFGFGDTYPWLYGDAIGFGFYGGWGHGFRYGGYREGFRGGGFHGGGYRR